MGLRIFRCPRIGEEGEPGVYGAVSKRQEMEIRTERYTTAVKRYSPFGAGHRKEKSMDISDLPSSPEFQQIPQDGKWIRTFSV